MTLRKVYAALVWMMGFFLIVNVFLIPSAVQTPRMTDIIGLGLGIWLMWLLTIRGMRFDVLVALFLFAAIPVIWGLSAYYSGDFSTVLLSVRWLLAVPWGYALFLVSRNPQHRPILIWGMLCGCLMNTAVLALQYYGLIEFTQRVGLAPQDTVGISYLSTERRTPGMEVHPNSSAAILSLAVPLTLYLYYGSRLRLWVVGLGIAILLACSQFTETRSALLVSIVTIGVLLLTRSNPRQSLRLAALLAYLGLPVLIWVGPPGGWDRWLDFDNVEANAGGRLLSSTGALQISLENPFGLGMDAGLRALYEETGIVATHNAFLQVGLAYGLLLAAAIFLTMLFFALQLFVNSRRAPTLEAVLALQVFGLFFFEEHFSAPTFVILTSWLFAACGQLLSDYLRVMRRSAHTSVDNRLFKPS